MDSLASLDLGLTRQLEGQLCSPSPQSILAQLRLSAIPEQIPL